MNPLRGCIFQTNCQVSFPRSPCGFRYFASSKSRFPVVQRIGQIDRDKNGPCASGVASPAPEARGLSIEGGRTPRQRLQDPDVIGGTALQRKRRQDPAPTASRPRRQLRHGPAHKGSTVLAPTARHGSQPGAVRPRKWSNHIYVRAESPAHTRKPKEKKQCADPLNRQTTPPLAPPSPAKSGIVTNQPLTMTGPQSHPFVSPKKIITPPSQPSPPKFQRRWKVQRAGQIDESNRSPEAPRQLPVH